MNQLEKKRINLMKINYIKELNSSKINLSPLNFWQAIGITILFDIITLFLNKPTDIFYIILNSLGVVTYSGFWMWISTALSAAYEFGAILILIIFLNNRNNKVNNINTGFKLRKRDWVLVPLLIVSYILLTYGWFDYILYFFPTGNTYEYVIEYLNSIPIVILLVETCIMAPFFEELLYRGIILNGLINRYSRKKAIIYSALIFGIAHLNFPQGINAFLLGLIIGTVYYYTRSIYLCMIMHFANNFLVNFVYYPTSQLWTNILFVLLPILGLVLMIYLFKTLNLKERSKEAIN